MLLSQVCALSGLLGPVPQLNEAKKLVMEGKYAEAEASVSALIRRQPSPAGFDLLGYIYEQQSKLDQAEQAYSQAVKLNPSGQPVRLRLGIVYGKKGKYADCIVALEKLPPNIRNDPEALFYLCRSYLETRNTAKALEIAAMVEQLKENDPGALLSIGRLLASKDLNQRAVRILKKAVDDLPNSAEANYCLALALFKVRNYDEMSTYLDQAQNLDPKAPRTFLLRALSLLDAGKISAAKDYIRSARELSPEDKFAAYLWGRVLIEEKNYSEAIRLINDLIASGFNDPNAHLSLMTAYRKNGQFEKALSYALRVVQIFPDNPSTYLRAGVELEVLGDFQQAEEFLRKAIVLGVNDSQIVIPAKFNLATISVKQGNSAEAVQLLKEVIDANPSDVYARVELADIYHKTRQYEQALKILRQALAFDSRNKRAEFLLGNVLIKLGKPVEADEHFKIFQELEKSAVKTQSENSPIYTLTIK